MRRPLSLVALVAGHFVTDCYMGMVAPLLPFVKERLELDLWQVGLVPVFTSLTASLLQPVFGWLCDRTRGAYLIGAGIAATGVGICTFGLAHSFLPMMGLLALGGLGCGAFHPAGAALAGIAGGKRRDLALAIFSPGGITGYSFGPVVSIWLYQMWGLDGMWPAMGVGLLVGPMIGAAAYRLERLRKAEQDRGEPDPLPVAKEMPRSWRLRKLSLLLIVVFLRSAIVIVFVAFLAQLLKVRGVPEKWWGLLTGAFTFGGGVAGLVGGALAHVVGRRRLTVVSLALTAPVLLAYLHWDASASWVLLVSGGALAQAAVPANIVQAQILLPNRQSLAAALIMGFCWGTAAFLSPVLGWVADATTLTFALSLSCALPVVAAVLALLVPDLSDLAPESAAAEPPVLPPPPVGVGRP